MTKSVPTSMHASKVGGVRKQQSARVRRAKRTRSTDSDSGSDSTSAAQIFADGYHTLDTTQGQWSEEDSHLSHNTLMFDDTLSTSPDDTTSQNAALSHQISIDHGYSSCVDQHMYDQQEDLVSLAQATFEQVQATNNPCMSALEEGKNASTDLPSNVIHGLHGTIQPSTVQDNKGTDAGDDTAAATTAQTSAVAANVIRPVPVSQDARQQARDGVQAFENEVRQQEGAFRSLLHHLLVVETGQNSFRARKLVKGREDEHFDRIKSELDTKLLFRPNPDNNNNNNDNDGNSNEGTVGATHNDNSSGIDPDWYDGQDVPDDPFSSRLQQLLFHALLVQYGSYPPLRPYEDFDFDLFAAECCLEARKWTLEMLADLQTEAVTAIERNEHRRTSRQSHMEIPATARNHPQRRPHHPHPDVQ